MGYFILVIAGMYLVAFALYLRREPGLPEPVTSLKELEAPPRKRPGRTLRRISGGQGTGFLAFGFVLLNVVDLFLTLRILQVGGTELNPVLGVSVGLGIPALAFHKTAVSAAFAWLLCRIRMERVLKLLTAGMLVVCLFNGACLIFW